MDPKVISVLQRGLNVLDVLNHAGVTDVRHIHQSTGLPKPTIVRLLDTLVALGYVARCPAGGYEVTSKVLGLSRGYRKADTEHLLKVARPALGWLRGQTAGWPSDMAVCDTDAMVVVDAGRGAGSQFLNRDSGYRLPIVGSALGHAYLAFCPNEEREDVLLRLNDRPGGCKSSLLGTMLESVRRKGFATRDCERGKATRVLAAAILVRDRVVACLSVVAGAQAVTLQQMEQAFATPLAQAAATIAQAYEHRNC
jgi:IclR family transcriptional regulator, mhp operon transcriptional activator